MHYGYLFVSFAAFRPCENHQVELRVRVGSHVLPDTGCRNTVFKNVAPSEADAGIGTDAIPD